MKPDYWIDRWKDGNIRFHDADPHRFLIEYFPHLNTRIDDSILVPLCGKSVDMTWIMSQSRNVVGVELSEIAIESFVEENNLIHTKSVGGEFAAYQGDRFKIFNGDLFHMSETDVCGIKAVYDRGSFVALPSGGLRERYADWMALNLSTGCKVLLVTFNFDQEEMAGPPFTANRKTIHQLFEKDFSITMLKSELVVNIKPHCKERGLKTLREDVYLLERF